MNLPYPAGAAGRGATVARLAVRLPEPLHPLAELAYNYRWSWTPGGPELFASIDEERWERTDHNPVKLLIDVPPARLARLAEDDAFLDAMRSVTAEVEADLERPFHEVVEAEEPIAFLCAEYGLHRSLRIYSGGLGILAGDILKEASDLALPMVAVGLFYRRGYFHQRLDRSGWQHEYWIPSDPDLRPMTLVVDEAGEPVRIGVTIRDREVALQAWRVDVGRVPLFLLDANLPENSPLDRWLTSTLYDSNPDTRLGQYAILGIGGVRLLEAIGVTPSVIHMNEGHAALATLETVAARVARGEDREAAMAEVAELGVFTTHTPVAAGNETYPAHRITETLDDLRERLQLDEDAFLGLGRVHPEDNHSEAGMTPVAMRLSRSVNGVSQRHGEVARGMWSPLFRVPPNEVPITHVTNGVHLPTWLGTPMRELLDRHLGEDWSLRAGDPATWEPVDDIPDAEVWAARTASRRALIDYVRARVATDRLARGEDMHYAQQALDALDPERLTVGFARRVAAYKRLYLLRHDPERVGKLLDEPNPIQLLFAGKAHPADDGAKGILQSMFDLKSMPHVAERVAFLEDYDMTVGAMLTAGSDVWINVPRPPLEASGTSGMKVVLNGGLNLSVIDGWWAEGYDGTNGWAIDGSVDHDHGSQDAHHASELYRLLEDEVIPTFNERNDEGVPTRWVAMVKSSLRTCGWRFTATRMMNDYVTNIYPR